MKFQIGGGKYEITRELIMEAARNVPPNAGDGRHKYFVAIHGRRYPIKQPVHLATGLPFIDFTAQHFHRILSSLGFEVFEQPPSASVTVEAADDGGRTFRLLVVFETDEDGWEVASCPSLPGCHSQGRTRNEAIANIRQAIGGYVASMREHGERLPTSTEFEVLEVTA